MKQELKDLSTHYNIDAMDVVKAYKEGLSMTNIAKKVGLGEMPVRTILLVLQLRLKQKHREKDYLDLMTKLAGSSDLKEQYLQEVGAELEFLHKENKKLNDALTRKVVELKILNKRAVQDRQSRMLGATIVEELKGELVPTNVIITGSSKPVKYEEGLCVCISDWHIGEVITADEVPNNEFNYSIAEQRIQKLLEEILDFPKQSKVINVFALGDWLHGIIHGGLNTSEESFAESIKECVKLLRLFLSTLSAKYKIVNCTFTGSNHDRVLENPVTYKKYADYGFVIFSMLEIMFEGTNVQLVSDKSTFGFTYVNNATIFAMHGDSLRNFNVTSDTSTTQAMDLCEQVFGVRPNHIVAGHFHHAVTYRNHTGGTNVQTGCLSGSNSYGLHNGFRPVTPSQPIFFVEENGCIDLVSHVTLD